MVARMKVSGTARPTVAPAPCGLMFTARLAPIAAMDSEIAPQVVRVRRSAGLESVEGPLVAVMCFAPPGNCGLPGVPPSHVGSFPLSEPETTRPGGRQSAFAARLTET